MRADLHQHLWTAPLLEALEQRRRLPFARTRDGTTEIHAAGESPWSLDPLTVLCGQQDRLAANGLDRAAVALSSPLGIEVLPRREALQLIDAHLEGVASLPDDFMPWGPIALDEPRADDVDELLARGCVGISLPAGAIADREGLARLAPVLERIAARGVPLFLHPGPGAGGTGREAPAEEAAWWPALTGYVNQMQAAWLRFACAGRRGHPDLLVVFAMLAGCAPLQAERLELRGGEAPPLDDPLTFYDTSGYGSLAISIMGQVVGECQLVYGSDLPVVAPPATERDAALQRRAGEVLEGVASAR